jgi:uncharacterized membrane protein
MNEQLMVKYKGRYRSYFRLAESESSTASQRLQPYWAHIVSIAIVAKLFEIQSSQLALTEKQPDEKFAQRMQMETCRLE